jgi:hypothetical protein
MPPKRAGTRARRSELRMAADQSQVRVPAKALNDDKFRTIARLRRFVQGGLGPALREFAQPRVITEIPRLLREGAGPAVRLFIQARNTGEIAQRLREGTGLNFISSFPRSGNTWMRYLLTDILLQNSGVATTTQLPVHPDKVVPDFYCHSIGRRDRSVQTPGLFVKTHDLFDQLERRFCGKALPDGGGGPLSQNCKHLYLYRAAEDVLVSLFHYYDRHRYFRSQSASGADAFCQARLAAWQDNLTSYLRASEKGVPILFVKYELLLKEPSAALAAILRWLDIAHDGSMVGRAVRNMRFSELRALEIRERPSEEGLSFRRGASGGGKAELQPSTVEAIHRSTSELIQRADSRALALRPIGESCQTPNHEPPLNEPMAAQRDPKQAAASPEFEEA